jgi:hypothetical protein
MKKLLTFVALAALAVHAYAEEEEAVEEESLTLAPVEVETPRKTAGIWPAFFVVGEIPSADIAPDVVGLRLTIPYSSSQECVTGLDVAFWGRALMYEGLMLNVLRNDAKDRLAGFQIGLYNSAGAADSLAIQVGLWNEAGSLLGLQAGLVNLAGDAVGIQAGLINRCEQLYGFQVGLINLIRCGELTFMPLVNIGF